MDEYRCLKTLMAFKEDRQKGQWQDMKKNSQKLSFCTILYLKNHNYKTVIIVNKFILKLQQNSDGKSIVFDNTRNNFFR
ncbi:hypothetical protein BpHYR1_004863 [Brachionus plicatilis]|uniref:Uncharacterized protein n=1 Tax=Brachionus plicatilis TaxID=10195 RepID=A0A3M7SYH3_BRAPC|nr:hypothetical protein BpHYR1_004863 [Brachionus plicatilis]